MEEGWKTSCDEHGAVLKKSDNSSAGVEVNPRCQESHVHKEPVTGPILS